MTKKISSAPSYRETDLEITDSGLLLQLLGPNDCNIKLIKKAFKIKIWLRGNLIKMSGPGEGIEAAEMVIAALTQLVESGKDIDTFDVENCITKSDNISPEVRYSKKAGVVKTSKKTITAKGPNQLEYIQNIEDTDVTFGIGPAGCHRKGQLIIMYDGTLKAVEDVKVGDQLMGPDSTPRNVLELHTGHEEMVEIIPVKGEPWVVNKGHILTVKKTYQASRTRYRSVSEIKDVPVRDWQNWSKAQKACHKLLRVAVNFNSDQDPLPIDPYFLGLLLGDGHIGHSTPIMSTTDPEILKEIENQAALLGMRVSKRLYVVGACPSYGICNKTRKGSLKNTISEKLEKLELLGLIGEDKFIPHIYKISSREDRLALLAGLLDTDGSLNNTCFDFVNKSKKLVDDVAFIARSLGFACYPKPCRKKCQTGAEGTYYRLMISGHTDEIPVRIDYKKANSRKQIKNVLHTGFKTKDLPPEDYYGFVLDGDHRYLLEDFTVTHNTGKTYISMACAIQAVLSGKFRKIVLCRPAVEAGEKLGFLPGDLAEKVNPYLRPLYDALGDMVEADKAADMIKNGVIEVAPLAFLRGRSLNHSFILLDEAQNTTVEQMKMFLTRMGNGSKMVITGDSTQVDLELPEYKRNGLDDAVYLLEGVTGVAVTRFTSSDVVRHPLVQRIVCAYDARDERRKKDQRN